jgi:hypothetical protein
MSSVPTRRHRLVRTAGCRYGELGSIITRLIHSVILSCLIEIQTSSENTDSKLFPCPPFALLQFEQQTRSLHCLVRGSWDAEEYGAHSCRTSRAQRLSTIGCRRVLPLVRDAPPVACHHANRKWCTACHKTRPAQKRFQPIDIKDGKGGGHGRLPGRFLATTPAERLSLAKLGPWLTRPGR